MENAAGVGAGGARGAARRALAFVGARWIFAFLALEVLWFALTSEGFARAEPLQTMLFNEVEVLLLAAAELFVIITGGIDLSVGYVLGFASIVSTKVIAALVAGGMDPLAALAVGAAATMIVGVVPGLVNGWLVAYLDVPPFIATFSMLGVCHGVSELIIEGVYATGLPQLAATLGRGHLAYRAEGGRWTLLAPPEVERGTEVLALVPNIVVLAAAVLLALGFLLARTRFGRHVYAIGGNREAAARAGIPVRRRLLAVYALSAMLASLAGLFYALKFVSGKADAGASGLLDSIAAVMIGGASMFGGSGTVGRTVAGCLVIGVLEQGLRMGGTSTFDKLILVGVVLVAAVVVERYLPEDRR